MNKIKDKFQSRDFDFPKIVYIGCIYFVDKDGEKRHLCLTRIFDNVEILRPYVIFVIDDLFRNGNSSAPIFDGLYIKCEYSHLFPMKKSYWEDKSQFKMDTIQKFRNDVNILKYWKMSEVLVTPDGEVDGKEFYSFCISLFKNTEKKHLETFIKNSGQSVDIRAKNAAFYSLSKPVKINWLEDIKRVNDNKLDEKYIN